VLRLGVGDRVVLVDGRGGWYEAAIEDDHPKKCQLKILSHTRDYQPLSYSLHIAVSPTRNMDRNKNTYLSSYEYFVVGKSTVSL